MLHTALHFSPPCISSERPAMRAAAPSAPCSAISFSSTCSPCATGSNRRFKATQGGQCRQLWPRLQFPCGAPVSVACLALSAQQPALQHAAGREAPCYHHFLCRPASLTPGRHTAMHIRVLVSVKCGPCSPQDTLDVIHTCVQFTCCAHLRCIGAYQQKLLGVSVRPFRRPV